MKINYIQLMKLLGVKLCLLLSMLNCDAQSIGDQKQNLEILESFTLDYLSSINPNVPRENMRLTPLDRRLKLAQCESLNASLSQGSRSVGNLLVFVRCLSPQNWQIYIRAKIISKDNYYSLAKSINSDKMISDDDIQTINSDVTSAPNDAVTNKAKIIGKQLLVSLPAGTILRESHFREVDVIVTGQNVRVAGVGKNFSISTEGISQNSAKIGQLVRVKTQSGQIINGVANADGIVELKF